MLNDKDAVIDQLTDLANEVDSSDPKGAIRLRELGDAVRGGQYADAWAGNNLYNLINIDAIVNRYRVQQKVDGRIALIETTRNIFIFLPLFFTWLGIARAIPAYYNLVTQYPKFSTTPFLQLWQGGFNGTAPWGIIDTLGGVATIDCILISVIIVLTFSSSILTHKSQMKRDRKAEDLRDNLAHALAGATLFLSTRHWTQPTNFVDRFNTVVNNFNSVISGLEEQIKIEREELAQLAERQRQEFALFNSFKSSLVTSMDNVATTIRDLMDSQKVLDTTINRLVAPTEQTAAQQKTLLVNSQNTLDQLTRHAVAQEEVVAQQKLWGEKLNGVLFTLDGTVTQAKTLAAQIAQFTEEQKGLVKLLQIEHDDQAQLVKDIITNTNAMNRIIKQIDESATNINGVTVNMGEVARRIAAKVPV
ncbi:hypothetical protein [Dictyobacter formicarum]|uniref:MotA/TolQ/ExbB proton channel domain-containing protein n=1 Tax=Dictyobacter formicarum TaxID=2778368 RepID=A0ABQ3VLW1_9CHLR|nr:hypothetical protein [Dictyobacter formicarum]GHO86343.1 hypothetical protein KSZ_43490 [Dictyobacter formicarum]